MRKTLPLKTAQEIAEGIVSQLSPYCSRILIAGSIRRQRPQVHDIDLVIIPNNEGMLAYELMRSLGAPKISGKKLICLQMPLIAVDIYIATPGTWAGILLIRTGSAEHNKRLCALAKIRGMCLHADGRGVTKDGIIKSGDTELSIFEALGMKYVEPELRECHHFGFPLKGLMRWS